MYMYMHMHMHMHMHALRHALRARRGEGDSCATRTACAMRGSEVRGVSVRAMIRARACAAACGGVSSRCICHGVHMHGGVSCRCMGAVHASVWGRCMQVSVASCAACAICVRLVRPGPGQHSAVHRQYECIWKAGSWCV